MVRRGLEGSLSHTLLRTLQVTSGASVQNLSSCKNFQLSNTEFWRISPQQWWSAGLWFLPLKFRGDTDTEQSPPPLTTILTVQHFWTKCPYITCSLCLNSQINLYLCPLTHYKGDELNNNNPDWRLWSNISLQFIIFLCLALTHKGDKYKCKYKYKYRYKYKCLYTRPPLNDEVRPYGFPFLL